MKNICFVSNFEKTYVFNEVAKELEQQHNVKVFWVVVNEKYKTFLEANYAKDHILYIHKGLESVSKPVGEYKLNEMVFNDRFLSLNKNEGRNFLSKIQEPIYNFLSRNEIQYVFGELTWAHELLISRIVNAKKSLNCSYLNPHVVRIPNNRFAFFQEEKEDLILDGNINYINLDYPLLELKKPEYLAVNNKILEKSKTAKSKLDRIKRFLSKENVEINDPSLLYNFKNRLKRGVVEELNKRKYSSIKTVPLTELENKKYITYPLHKQPEASIDVLGKYYNDQWINIYNIWKILPNEWYLVVKEHSNAIGDRNRSFYDKIQNLPNTLLLNEKSDSYQLIKNSQAVFTVSGTVAYEASMMGKISFTFSPMFFNKLKNCFRVSIEDFSNCNNFIDLIKLKEVENNNKLDIKTFSNFVYYHSYEGTWTPTSPHVMDNDNIKKLAKSITNIK